MSSRITWMVLAAGLVGCGLSVVGTGVLGSGDEPDGSAALHDGGGNVLVDGAIADGGTGLGDAMQSPDGNVTTDGGAVADGSCFLLVSDDFTNPDPRWKTIGLATFDAGAAVLVTPPMQSHGAIFIPVGSSAPVKSFTATFTMLMDPAMGGGDGILLAWASDVGLPAIGGTGSELGFCPDSNSSNVGPIGAGLALHVASDVGVSPRESDGGSCVVPNATPYNFTTTQPVSASISGVYIDAGVGTSTFNYVLSKAVPIRWIGFTAATGGNTGIFSVDDVSITVCP